MVENAPQMPYNRSEASLAMLTPLEGLRCVSVRLWGIWRGFWGGADKTIRGPLEELDGLGEWKRRSNILLWLAHKEQMPKEFLRVGEPLLEVRWGWVEIAHGRWIQLASLIFARVFPKVMN